MRKQCVRERTRKRGRQRDRERERVHFTNLRDVVLHFYNLEKYQRETNHDSQIQLCYKWRARAEERGREGERKAEERNNKK